MIQWLIPPIFFWQCEEDSSNGTAMYSVAELAPIGEVIQTSETSQQASTVNQVTYTQMLVEIYYM